MATAGKDICIVNIRGLYLPFQGQSRASTTLDAAPSLFPGQGEPFGPGQNQAASLIKRKKIDLFAGYENRNTHFPPVWRAKHQRYLWGRRHHSAPNSTPVGHPNQRERTAWPQLIGREGPSPPPERSGGSSSFFSLQFYLQKVLKLFVQHLIKMRLSN